MADVKSIEAAVSIVDENPARRFVVPSAPGKRNDDDKKVTDLFYAWFHLIQDGMDTAQPRDILEERFAELAKGLGVSVDIGGELERIAREAASCATPDYLASRGEYLNGLILAELLDASFVDPRDSIKFDYEGNLLEESYGLLGARLKGPGRYVVPGFYGSDPDGKVKTFSRGGSDVTGAVVARASRSGLYENWTDVCGLRMTDPRIVPEARRIEEITYSELRELSYMGASVMHDEAIFPVRQPGIPIHLLSSKEPESPGTKIVPSRESPLPVCGIAARTGFTMINIEKNLMNREIGFGRRVLSVLEEHKVNFEHMPTGIDTISVIVKDEELEHHGEAITEGICRTCSPDKVGLSPGLALIATVGQGMNHHVGVAARLCAALSQAGVNLRVIDQGSSEMNIIVGVDADDLNTAVRAIYLTFESWTG